MSWLSNAANKATKFVKKNSASIAKGALIAGAGAVTGGAALPVLLAAGTGAVKAAGTKAIAGERERLGVRANVTPVADVQVARQEAAAAAGVAAPAVMVSRRQLVVWAGAAIGAAVLLWLVMRRRS